MTMMILWAVLLFLVHTFLPPLFRFYLRPDPQVGAAIGNRDETTSAPIHADRADRTLRNMIEAMLLFTPVALLAATQPGVDEAAAIFGAQVFLVARIAYAPIYILGVPVLRTLVWTAGHIGVLLIALELI